MRDQTQKKWGPGGPPPEGWGGRRLGLTLSSNSWGKGPPGFHTTAQTCTFEGPGLQKHHQNSTRRPQRERERAKMEAREGEKKAKCWAVWRRGVWRGSEAWGLGGREWKKNSKIKKKTKKWWNWKREKITTKMKKWRQKEKWKKLKKTETKKWKIEKKDKNEKMKKMGTTKKKEKWTKNEKIIIIVTKCKKKKKT